MGEERAQEEEKIGMIKVRWASLFVGFVCVLLAGCKQRPDPDYKLGLVLALRKYEAALASDQEKKSELIISCQEDIASWAKVQCKLSGDIRVVYFRDQDSSTSGFLASDGRASVVTFADGNASWTGITGDFVDLVWRQTQKPHQ